MISKSIQFFGQPSTLVCDGLCHKAWGMNNRPRKYFIEAGQPPRELEKEEAPPDIDDYIYVGDNELGDAPENPGTYEGGDSKPCVRIMMNSGDMNKWCARECERSNTFEPGETVVVRDMKNPQPNFYRRRDMKNPQPNFYRRRVRP